MTLKTNYQNIIAQIRTAEHEAQRPEGSVQLVAVSKTFAAEHIRALYQCGQYDFGENYIQEWYDKTEQLYDCPDIIWHIIGHIQSNKTRLVAERAHWVHTLDRVKIADRLNSQRPDHCPPLQVCIEINITDETNKHGIAPNQLLPLARHILTLPKLQLRGLMCVAAAHASEAELRQQFQHMVQLFNQLKTIIPQADTLSMGMSADMTLAIECGANMVRVGTAIFGKR